MILHVIRLLVRHTLYIAGYSNHIQNRPHNCRGVFQTLGFNGKTHRIGSEPPKTTRVSDEARQMMASGWRIWRPIEGTWHPQALYLSLDREVSFTPFVWASINPSGYFSRIIWEKRAKPPGLDLIGGH
jgi:hypothetical protein